MWIWITFCDLPSNGWKRLAKISIIIKSAPLSDVACELLSNRKDNPTWRQTDTVDMLSGQLSYQYKLLEMKDIAYVSDNSELEKQEQCWVEAQATLASPADIFFLEEGRASKFIGPVNMTAASPAARALICAIKAVDKQVVLGKKAS